MVTLYHGDCREVMATMEANSIHCIVTSPPYWGLRDYGVDGQLGVEHTPEVYVANLVAVFREARRLLRDDGTVWLNLGDSYVRSPAKGSNLKAKNLVGIPWRVALALQGDGWFLRSDIIWSKPNVMPENVKDRPTKSHEYIFLLTKQSTYYFDNEAVREKRAPYIRKGGSAPSTGGGSTTNGIGSTTLHQMSQGGRNIRTVWNIPTKAHRGAHFATFPARLVEPCIRAGAPVGGLVLDPFAGSGTVGEVARSLDRRSVLIELSDEYLPLIAARSGLPV